MLSIWLYREKWIILWSSLCYKINSPSFPTITSQNMFYQPMLQFTDTNPHQEEIAAQLSSQPQIDNHASTNPQSLDAYENEANENSQECNQAALSSSDEDEDTNSQSLNEIEPTIDEEKFTHLTNEDKIEAAIRNWYVACPNMPRSNVSKLLESLHKYYPSLHLSSQTVLGADHPDCTIVPMCNGRLVMFNDWIDDIRSHLIHIGFHSDELHIILNVDGIPVFNDRRNYHAYPILIQCCTKPMKIICAGLYLSEDGVSNKMPEVDTFLLNFVEKIEILLSNPLIIKNSAIVVKIKSIVCDAPVRSDLKKIVNHNGYNSCERCVQRGSRAGGHTVLLNINAPKRTDAQFLEKFDIHHHREGQISILRKLDIGFISSFALDYMHLVCLGVTKRLLTRLKGSKSRENKCHIPPSKLVDVNDRLKELSNWIPLEFSRKVSSGLHSLSSWKATEFRMFLLYVGIVALHGAIPSAQYMNFLYLSLAMRYLLSSGQENNLESIKRLLINFFLSSRRIYGNDFVSYNVHSIIHLADDYEKWGPLDNVSCFPFENYLGQI